MPLDLDKTLSILNLFGVRYVITDDELDLPLLYDKGPHIYRNDETLPAALVVYQARVVKDRETRLDTLRTSTFDPRTTVLLSHLPSQPLPLPTGGVTKGQISQPEPTILREGPDRVTIQVDMTQPGYLVLSDVYYPGWQATVDGKPSEILPANHAFRAVILDEGKHTIVFEYKALSFRTGAWLTIGTTLLLVTALIVGWLRGGSRPTSDLQSPTVNRRVA